ncbi:hypothetical protein FB45DRAFT_1090884 [Roridomyces roridus]|uniref:Uncharacterized protein n=1 Tax=Roridomyces roridus TaxID=1738132 RepID=A0AAD7BIE4_9AGAR|nr:hypothetical protein FB45DRAFT_1090884 [Roridomyces roridus]
MALLLRLHNKLSLTSTTPLTSFFIADDSCAGPGFAHHQRRSVQSIAVPTMPFTRLNSHCSVSFTPSESLPITLLPCLRAAFDATVTMALLLGLHNKLPRFSLTSTTPLTSFFIAEAIRDLVMIFVIMAMEAVFVQIPSVSHFLYLENPNSAKAKYPGARPRPKFTLSIRGLTGTDCSLTAILVTRFLLELSEKSRQPRELGGNPCDFESVALQLESLVEEPQHEELGCLDLTNSAAETDEPQRRVSTTGDTSDPLQNVELGLGGEISKK